MDSETIIGAAGSLLILLAFVLLQFKVWGAHTTLYLIANLIGSVLLVAYAILLNSIPFIVLNIVWALVALIGILRRNNVIPQS